MYSLDLYLQVEFLNHRVDIGLVLMRNLLNVFHIAYPNLYLKNNRNEFSYFDLNTYYLVKMHFMKVLGHMK